jgi:carbon monoxide dehydrogenase subunit G
MLLKLSEELSLSASTASVWSLLRDTPRLAALLPGVDSVSRIEQASTEAYSARVSEKIGPFKISMNLEVRVTEAAEPSELKASLKGSDLVGLNRMTGTLEIALTTEADGTRMHFDASIEILGKLATLGAIPIRRRAAQVFAEFAKNIRGQFPGGAAPV